MTSIPSVITARTNGALIVEIAPLWIRPDDLVVDVTYGRGKWWTKYQPERFVAHDLGLAKDAVNPDGVDFRSLPEADDSVDVVAFDPAYVTPGGRETSTLSAKGSDQHDRYGMTTTPSTPAENMEIIVGGVKEAARVLRSGSRELRSRKPGGRLLLKVMDYIWSGDFQNHHHQVVSAALEVGLVQVDEFIHVSGSGPQPKTNRDGSPRRQVHSRHDFSFLCVFQARRVR